MESKLIVRNFGPIKDVSLDLRNVNVFIGPQATGKSALAKIYTICKAPRKFLYKKALDTNLVIDNQKASKEFRSVLQEYNIESFLNDDTEITFESELHTFSYNQGVLQYAPKLLNKISTLEPLFDEFDKNKNQISATLAGFAGNFIFFNLEATNFLAPKKYDEFRILTTEQFQLINQEDHVKLLAQIKSIEEDLSTNTALYIPAERNFINIIKKSALNLQLNQVPIPKHILSFGAEIEKLDVKEINLDFIQKGIKYKIVNGEDKIYINDEKSIMLTEAASGIQSVVPLLAPILKKSFDKHRSFVIEEPELNLFPIAQYELIQFLESSRDDPFSKWEDYGTIHTYTTHSPYILSALNNLLYADKVRGELNTKTIPSPFNKEEYHERNMENIQKIKKIVKALIDPSSFRAYQINDGFAKSIFNIKEGLIEENYIDMASDKISEDFSSLMELTR